jgi:hypothetical protein
MNPTKDYTSSALAAAIREKSHNSPPQAERIFLVCVKSNLFAYSRAGSNDSNTRLSLLTGKPANSKICNTFH